MSDSNIDICWSPTAFEHFIVYESDLKLYEIKSLEQETNISPPNYVLNSESIASLVSIKNEYQDIQCVEWCVRTDDTHQLLAVGQGNGSIYFTTFDTEFELSKSTIKEFIPLRSRRVASLAWNPHDNKTLAAGYERMRNEFPIALIDITNSESLYYFGSNNETANSVAFSIHSPDILFSGISNKQLKLFDVRKKRPTKEVMTKAVYGLSDDPSFEKRFASYADNQICIWDERNLERPVVNLHLNKAVTKISWCTARSGYLAATSQDSSRVRIYDIYHEGRDDQEPVIITRSIDSGKSSISAVSWHPNKAKMLIVSNKGEIEELEIYERMTLNWSPSNSLVWTSGKCDLNVLDIPSCSVGEFDDISTTILKRAKKNYGYYMHNLSKNGQSTDDVVLQNLWAWLEKVFRILNNGVFSSMSNTWHPFHGLLNLLTLNNLRSEVVNKQWIGLEGSRAIFCRIYKSDERVKALELCFWGYDNTDTLVLLLEELQAAGNFTRAAAIAIFNLQLRLAIQILQRGAITLSLPILNATAMAFAGFTDNQKALWQSTCSSLLMELTDSYLKAAFTFMTSTSDNYEEILKENSIEVQDRIAFACLFLSDISLIEFLEALCKEHVKMGDLDGLILTGISDQGIDLLQKYIDVTCDIQTVALIVAHTSQHNLSQDPRLNMWVQKYKDLLDSHCLWNLSAQLDIIQNQGRSHSDIHRSISVACNYCKQSIWADCTENSRSRSITPPSNITKMSCCPKCKKALPRCSLCLNHMGTPSGRRVGSFSRGPSVDENRSTFSNAKKVNDVNLWISWCQTCWHGGHASHLLDWFSLHSECPVSGCHCRCMDIDPIGKMESLSLEG